MKEMICEKCRRIIVEDVCPICGCTDVHEPAENDYCYLISADHAGSVMISKLLEQKGIPYKMKTISTQSRYSLSSVRYIYVPYGRLEEAELELDNFQQRKQPVEDFLSEGFGPDLFHAEEIDRMEWANLDNMEPEELKAYKEKIVKTLKEIKAQEQQWKTRITKLLDMKEEAEGLIEDLE